MINQLPAPIAKAAPIAIPLAIIALARIATFSSAASSYPQIAAALFAWIVADTLLLAVIYKARDHKPAAFNVLGALVLASVVIIAGASAPLRDVYFSLPQVLAAAALTGAVFSAWSTIKIVKSWLDTGSIASGLEAVLPKPLVKALASECAIVSLALFKWGVPADVPAGTRAFTYHTYVNPMIITFMVLQLIELSVVHLLLMLWNPTVAWVLLALSVWGVIWTLALLKSFRIKPVLIGQETVTIRSGMIYEFEVARSNLIDEAQPFNSEELSGKSVLNLAIMSAPNVALRFVEPVRVKTFMGGHKLVSGVGLRLDDSAGFLNTLACRG